MKADYYRQHRDVMLEQAKRSQARRYQEDPERIRASNLAYYRRKRAEHQDRVRPIIESMRAAGSTWAAIANALHEADSWSYGGTRWTACSVRYVIEPPFRHRKHAL